MNFRDRDRLRRLEMNTRNGGWLGGGGRESQHLVYGVYGSGVVSAQTLAPYKAERLSGGYPPPDGGGSHSVVGETRAYIGKGEPGGSAEAFTWDYRELVLVAESIIECQGIIEMPLAGMPGMVMDLYVPFVVFVYPILEPWTLPGTDRIVSSEPYTTFHDNLALGAPCGWVNPATGNIDNYMAQHSAGQLWGVTPGARNFVCDIPGANVLSWQDTFEFEYLPHASANVSAPHNRPGWASPSGIPLGPFSKSKHLEITNPPSTPIYGVGLFAFSIFDYYFWTTDSDPSFLLSRATIPPYIIAMTSFETKCGLASLNLPNSLTWEAHIWESEDTGLTDAEIMCLRTAGVYEDNERAILLV